MRRWIPVPLMLAAMLLMRCAAPAAPQETPAVQVPEEARALIDAAREELIRRMGEVDQAIDLIDVEPVEWPDAAMGCPEPGRMYAQVVTPGYRIRLRMQDQEYEVHVSKRGEVRLCQAEEEKEEMGIPESARPAVAAARRDLASRLGVATADVRVVEFEGVEWRDSSLGCPQPGMMYLQVITPGYRVVLQVGNETYEYHTDRGTRAVLCQGREGNVPPAKPLVNVRRAIEKSRADLAQRQGVDVQAITVVDATPMDRLASPEECPGAENLAAVSGPEFQVVLKLAGQTYVYRVRGDSVVLCQ